MKINVFPEAFTYQVIIDNYCVQKQFKFLDNIV